MTTENVTALAQATPPFLDRVKIPMSWAAAALADLCDQIDNGVEPTKAVSLLFQERKLDLAEAVDRRIAFVNAVDAQIEAARKAKDAWAAQVRSLEALLAAMKAGTKEIIEAHPDLPYKGSIGRLAVQKNPPAVKTTFGDKV